MLNDEIIGVISCETLVINNDLYVGINPNEIAQAIRSYPRV